MVLELSASLHSVKRFPLSLLFLSPLPLAPRRQTTPLSLSPSFFPFLSLSIGRLQPPSSSSEDACFSACSSQSDSQYGSPPRGWSEEMDERGHKLYVSEHTNEKVPAAQLALCGGGSWGCMMGAASPKATERFLHADEAGEPKRKKLMQIKRSTHFIYSACSALKCARARRDVSV